jgi:hypothetical protein
MMKSGYNQISPADSDARSMATSGKDTGTAGYNVQIAFDRVGNCGRHRCRSIFKMERRLCKTA